MAVTLKHVAKEAGCSIRVASAILNNREGNVFYSRQTKERVGEIASELGYISKNGSLNAKVTGTILVVGGDFHPRWSPSEGFVMRTLNAVSQEFYELDLSPYNIFSAVSVDNDRTFTNIKRLIGDNRSNIIGAVLFHCSFRPIVEYFEEIEFPYVLLNPYQIQKTNCVIPDDEGGAELAIKYLNDLRHEKIVYVQNTGEGHYSVELRRATLEKTCKHFGIELIVSDFDEDIQKQLEGVIAQKSSAIVCYRKGIDIYFSLVTKFGLKVPDDISLLSLHSDEFLNQNIPLTFIDVPFADMGRCAARSIYSLIRSRRMHFENRVLKERLVLEDSCSISKEFRNGF